MTINAREKPARGDMQLDIQGLQLSRLFPELESTRQSVGTLYGRGDSVAELLGSSNGQLTFAIDTTDTVVAVVGTIDFKQERLDLVFHAEPKDMSIFVLRSPIRLEGPFKRPKVRPEAGPIIARVAGAALLAAINPAPAILPFIETGPGKDSDCVKLTAQVHAKGAVKKTL